MLWNEGGEIGRFALILNLAGFVLTGDLTWLSILWVIGHSFPAVMGITDSILKYEQIFCSPLILLLIGSFYLWVYMHRVDTPSRA